MISLYRVLLAFHVIAVISWMAGILYLIRLFVYHAMETEAIVRTRFKEMERKLYTVITFPAMVVAVLLGLAMIGLQPGLLQMGWLHAKLTFVAALVGVTLYCGRLVYAFDRDVHHHTSRFYRFFNEVPTLLMIVIVLLVILKPF